MKKLSPLELPQIIYARATLRNLIEVDVTGNTDELVAAVALMDEAERLWQTYVIRQGSPD